MALDNLIARAFAMDDRVWARHANPWSVWTRLLILPLLAAAVWSRVWIGWWALVPCLLLALWTWLNPRVFPEPRSTDNWASRGVLGERVWLNRGSVPVPSHHGSMAMFLALLSGLGLLPLMWGLVGLAVLPTLLGLIVVVGGKLWFLDRMNRLFEEMKDADPRYRAWLY